MIPWTPGATLKEVNKETLQFLHSISIGHQNMYDSYVSFMGSSEKPYPMMGVNDSHMVLTLERDPLTPNTYFAHIPFHGAGLGFTNLRVKGDLQSIQSVSFIVGGWPFETLYARASGCCDSNGGLNFWMVQEGRAFPFLQYHPIYIQFTMKPEYSGDLSLSLIYDSVSVKRCQEFPIFPKREGGVQNRADRIHDGLWHLLIDYSHPLMNLNVRTEHPMREVRLLINNTIELPFLQVGESLWQLEFSSLTGCVGDLGLTMNASQVDTLAILMEGTDPGEVVSWAQSMNIVRLQGQGKLAGLAYTP